MKHQKQLNCNILFTKETKQNQDVTSVQISMCVYPAVAPKNQVVDVKKKLLKCLVNN